MDRPDSTAPTWELVLWAARGLTADGRSPFSRKQIIETIHLIAPNKDRTSIDPIIQGMTENATGGPQSACGVVLRRVDRGAYVLAGEPASSSRAQPRTPRCGQCGSSHVVPIVYGLPDSELFEAAESDEVELGGCTVFVDDPTPSLRCRSCGTAIVNGL